MKNQIRPDRALPELQSCCREKLSRAVLVFATLAALLLAFESRALEISFKDKAGEVLLSGQIQAQIPITVADFTVRALKEFQAQGRISHFQADGDGLYTIDDLTNDVEVVSDREIRAWGWCYEFNGQVPEKMPNEIKIATPDDQLVWFYGYAHYLNGSWIAQCVRGDSHQRTTRRK